MKDAVSTVEMKVRNSAKLWDAFIVYFENMYFPGAIEALDSGLVMLEYENFKLISAIKDI